MNVESMWVAVWTVAGGLAIEIAVVTAVCLIGHGLIRSAPWRRTIWQAGVLGILLAAVLEVSGFAQKLAPGGGPASEAAPAGDTLAHETSAVSFPALRGDFRERVAERLADSRASGERPARVGASAAPGRATPPPSSGAARSGATAAWPLLVVTVVWGVGTLVLGLRRFVRQLLLVFFFRGRRRLGTGPLTERLRPLARRLGEKREVRLFELRRLSGPIAFGIIRPSIGLPPGFESRFTGVQQEAMLAHELAHLAARDPLWYFLADTAVALVWWHPLVWWVRGELRVASETAADEASLLVADGPGALAECLVSMAAGLCRRSWIPGISGDGYRSGLGRRVKRLMTLEGAWRAPGRVRCRLAQMIGPLALVLVAVFGTAWAAPETMRKGEMKSNQSLWANALAFLAVLSNAGPTAGAPAEGTNAAARVEIEWQPWTPQAVAKAQQEGRPVLVNFAADWCVTSQANRKTSLETAEVRAQLRNINAVALWADWTKQDSRIADELRRHGRVGVPLTVVYAATGTAPKVLPEVLSEKAVLDALEQTRVAQARPGRAGSETVGGARLAAPAPGPGTPSANRQNLPPPFNMDPLMAARYGLIPHGAQTAAAPQPASKLQAKLDRIILDEVIFEALPLAEVLRLLQEESRKLDPDKQGVNFLLGKSSRPSPAIDPTTGAVTGLSEPIPLDTVTIRFNLPLRNVRLADVLEAVTRVAEMPIRYAVEDYAVVFSFAADQLSPEAGAAPLTVQTFQLNTNTLVAGLESAFGIALGQGKGAGVSKAEGEAADKQAAARRRSWLINEALRELLVQLGIRFESPRKLFYNDITGIVMVRAAADELDVIRAAIETLGGSVLMNYGGIPGAPGAAAPGPRGGFGAGFDGSAFGGGGSFGGGAGLSADGTDANTLDPATGLVSVLGEVNRPSRVQLTPGQPLTILDAVAESGGLTSLANSSKIEVTREEKKLRFDFKDLLNPAGQSNRFELKPGDVIYVPKTSF